MKGDWSMFKPTEFFANILLSGSKERLDKTVSQLDKFVGVAPPEADLLELERVPPVAESAETSESDITNEIRHAGPPEPSGEIDKLIEKFNLEASAIPVVKPDVVNAADDPDLQSKRSEVAAWRKFFGSLLAKEYSAACASVLDFISDRYGVESLVWLEKRDDDLDVLISRGALEGKSVKLGIKASNRRLREAAETGEPLVLRERRAAGQRGDRVMNLFPVMLGGDLRGAVGIEGDLHAGNALTSISRFIKAIGPEIEITRLRSDLTQRDWLARAVSRFNQSLKQIDSDDFWMKLTQISAELVGAERASLLVKNEKLDVLQAKASLGARVDLANTSEIGVRVSREVLSRGEPVVVTDIRKAGLGTAPADWQYKTYSFISYPILIGNKRLGVLNFTDKAGGVSFGQRDVDILEAIAPQIAVAIDRTEMRMRAGEYEQLSVTDSLTGLLNRRYIEERLSEEITRSKRHRFPMSLLMLDVDDFKSYNDTFGHPAGDLALQMVAEVLKETLRGADVAARYGGEEFSILLPQTSSDEAAAIAERIRQRIERTTFPGRLVTVSIGIASCTQEINSPKDLVSAADIALYEAKNSGRNNVQVFEDLGNSLAENIH